MSQEIADRALRVVVWSTGTIGRLAIAGVLAHPDLELVGVWTSTPVKDGQDVGVLAGLDGPVGVTATTDAAALLALAPDCIVHGAMTDDRVMESIADLESFVAAGVNVVSSGPVILIYPDQTLPAPMVASIEEKARAGGASLWVNGIDPGFGNDVLPLVLTSLSRRIDHLRVMEIADYSTYYQPVVMRDLFGFGRPLDFAALLWEPGVLTAAWGPVVRQLAAGLGVTLDPDLVERVDRRPAERRLETASVDIEEGTMGAVRFEVIGTVDGVPRITLEHVTRTAEDQVPEWPVPHEGGGCYRILVEGEPHLSCELTHHGESGDHNDSGMIITTQRLVNAVPAVVAAAPGLLTALDLPLVTGRGALA